MTELWFWLCLPYVLTLCVCVGFMAAMLEPPKPVYHWIELKG